MLSAESSLQPLLPVLPMLFLTARHLLSLQLLPPTTQLPTLSSPAKPEVLPGPS